MLESYSTKVVLVENRRSLQCDVYQRHSTRHLLIKLCRENLFRISNLIKSNRRIVEAGSRFQLILLNWGGDVGVFLWVWCVCEGWVYMFIWLGCVRRVGMYWRGREEKLHHYIIFVTLSSLVHEKNSIPST